MRQENIKMVAWGLNPHDLDATADVEVGTFSATTTHLLMQPMGSTDQIHGLHSTSRACTVCILQCMSKRTSILYIPL